MSDPILNFVSISGSQVAATTANFPNGARIVLVNKTSGATLPDPVTKVSDNGPLGITLSEDITPGAYYLKGLDQDGGYLAQSVEFYIA
jgi:hypothetical protein